MNKKVASVYETDDYRQFRHLLGNRQIDPARVKNVIESIETVGYIMCPIIVNEKKEIIDGQARCRALEKLLLPIHYIVVEGAGIDECIRMNLKQSNWKLNDFIDCYAELGNTSYKYLQILYNRYSHEFPVSTILYCVRGLGTKSGTIKNGKFECTADQYNTAMQTLEYLKLFNEAFVQAVGYKSYYQVALAYCFKNQDIDRSRLLKNMINRRLEITKVATIEQAFEIVEKIYNYRNQRKVYIYQQYRQETDNALKAVRVDSWNKMNRAGRVRKNEEEA